MDVYQRLLKIYSSSKRVESILDWCSRNRAEILFLESFGPLLKEISDPPEILFLRGNRECLNELSLAVVGARKASHYGLACSYRFARELAACGYCIVSGLAKGVDGASHRGALSVKGKTVAVMGSGFANLYPGEHRRLAFEILDKGGAWVSEYAPFEPPLAFHFPKRNRIISGLSLGTLVIEAGKKSGSLITALSGLEQGREVFVVPGPVDSNFFMGGHELIQNGAKLVSNIKDILEEFPLEVVTRTISEENLQNPFKFGHAFSFADWLLVRGEKAIGELPLLIEQGQVFEIAPQRYVSTKNEKQEDACQIKFS
ncbi:DNA-protecting protein DprA [bacterium]|nr:DNA-protecting protein DprA [bacterium]